METKKHRFGRESALLSKINTMVIAVQLPTGAVEIIINNEKIDEKIEYYLNAYNENMELKNNPDVKIVGWMFV